MQTATLSRTSKGRLLKLAAFLRTLPNKKFDLASCVSNKNNSNICNTTGCACGWATTVFRKLPKNKRLTLTISGDLRMVASPAHNFPYLYGFDAAAEFFKIGHLECEYLFSDTAYPKGRRGPKSVAQRIENFVANGKYTDKTYDL